MFGQSKNNGGEKPKDCLSGRGALERRTFADTARKERTFSRQKVDIKTGMGKGGKEESSGDSRRVFPRGGPQGTRSVDIRGRSSKWSTGRGGDWEKTLSGRKANFTSRSRIADAVILLERVGVRGGEARNQGKKGGAKNRCLRTFRRCQEVKTYAKSRR